MTPPERPGVRRGIRGPRGRASTARGRAPVCFADSVGDRDLVLFVLNVGDGDTQLLRLPRDLKGRRRLVIVDVSNYGKAKSLLQALAATDLIDPDDEIALLVATHHHSDHIRGMARLIRSHSEHISEFWEPGSMPPTARYVDLMGAVGAHEITHQQPTSGSTRYFGEVRLQVLAPSARLRQAFDLYGVDENDTSIVLRLDYPVRRVAVEPGGNRRLLEPGHQSLVLGADAQAHSWSHVLVDFPPLRATKSPVGLALRDAGFRNPLKAEALKVSHHGSKNGTYLELVDRVGPSVACISCGTHSRHGFPHQIALEALRESRQPIATAQGQSRGSDHELGLHQTCDTDAKGAPLGTIALVFQDQRSPVAVWRFGDAPSERVDLSRGHRCCPRV